MSRTRRTPSRSRYDRDCWGRRPSQTMPDAVDVHGRSRLIVDIIRGVLDDKVPPGGRPVAVLVDPEPEHWTLAEGRAVVVVASEPHGDDALAAIRRGAD